MAEKKSMSLTTAKAVARVKQGKNFQGKWGVGEHAATLRYGVLDLLPQASKLIGQPVQGGKPDASGKVPAYTLESAMNEAIKDWFRQDPELMYASNTQKLLVKCGELEESSEYE